MGRWSRALAAAVVSLAALSCSRHESPHSTIIIVVDALRADHLGAYGYTRPTSPHLDSWARQGRLFERAYSTSTWTLPSFASLYTGLWPMTHGAGMMGFNGPESIAANRLSAAIPTLAEVFAARGFATAAVVNHPLLEPAFGLDRGFQVYDHPQERGAARRADEMVDRSIALIDRLRERPFFLVLHLIDPHLNYDAPPPFRGKYSTAYTSSLALPVGDLNALRPLLGHLTSDDREFIKAAYDEEIAFVDQQLGRFRSTLAERGILDRTMIVVTADHGEEFFEHGGFEHGHAMWEEVLRVPLIVSGPVVRPGRETSPVSLVDIVPTLLDSLGGLAQIRFDGISLWPNLRTGAAIPARTLMAQGKLYGPEETMVLRWPLKLVVDGKLRPQRVSHLAADPGERHDLDERDAESVNRMLKELRAYLATTPLARDKNIPALDPGVLDRLRSLGYVH